MYARTGLTARSDSASNRCHCLSVILEPEYDRIAQVGIEDEGVSILSDRMTWCYTIIIFLAS